MQKMHMKNFLATLLCLTLFAALVVSDASAQTRKRSRLRGKKSTAAIIGGGAVAGALVGGPIGAAIGAGIATGYVLKKRADRKRDKQRKRSKAAGTYIRRNRTKGNGKASSRK